MPVRSLVIVLDLPRSSCQLLRATRRPSFDPACGGLGLARAGFDGANAVQLKTFFATFGQRRGGARSAKLLLTVCSLYVHIVAQRGCRYRKRSGVL